MTMKTVRAIQATLESGETDSRTVVAACLDRIEQIDSGDDGLHAILEINPDAQAIAEQCDSEREAGRVRGPLHGIPVIVKGNIDTADAMTTTAGSLALKGHIAKQDAFLVSRLRAAGAVILGKANLSEWANFRGARSVSGWSSLGGQTRNPHDPRRSPSGSSSGSAVAVAAGMVPLSIGTETDGSIVGPAHTCGVVGIKPTLGLVSRRGIIPIAHSQDTAGPMATCVEDAALLLNAIAGTDPEDEATSDASAHADVNYAADLSETALKGIRVGVMRNAFGKHPKVDRLIAQSLQTLEAAGATLIDPADIETDGTWGDTEMEVLLYEYRHGLNIYLNALGSKALVHSIDELIRFNREHQDEVLPFFGQELLERASAKGPLTEQAYVDALATNHRLTRSEGIDATLAKHNVDVLVAPTGAPAWQIDHVLGDLHLGGCSSVAAVSGYPHITVPAGKVAGLPVGLSFIGSAWAERQLIQYAYAFERARDADLRD